MGRILAAADIGSNTTHILVADANGKTFNKIENANEWIPLGELVTRHGSIPDSVVVRLIDTVRQFKALATARKAEAFYLFATGAVRAAENQQSVIARVKRETNVRTEVVSSERETALSLRGAELDTQTSAADYILEVGGGSVQIGLLEGGMLMESESMMLGTGAVSAKARLRSPCTDSAFAAAASHIESLLSTSKLPRLDGSAIGCGGVIRGLWRALHPDGAKTIYREELEYICWVAQRLSGEALAQRFNVKPRRAGTLLPGAMVYLALVRRLGLREIVVSENGIREGAIREMAQGRITGWRV